MEVTIRGTKYEISSDEVQKAIKNVDPQRITKYYIEIDNKRFPIKQVIAEVLKIPPMEFSTMVAYNILRDLGFEIKTQRRT